MDDLGRARLVCGGVSADHLSHSANNARAGAQAAPAGWPVVPGRLPRTGRERALTEEVWAPKPILYSTEPQAPRLRWVFEGDPRPGFKPKTRQAQILSKFKGRVWIDKQEEQWVKI